jgi:hypothetical protein
MAHVEDLLDLDAELIVTVFAQADNYRFSDNRQILRLDITLPSCKATGQLITRGRGMLERTMLYYSDASTAGICFD